MKAAFIFLAAGAAPERHRTVIETPDMSLITVGASSYAEAAEAARSLLSEGVSAIELCGGFGHTAAATVADAVGDGAKIGVVRFDGHPGLGGKSGDDVFAD